MYIHGGSNIVGSGSEDLYDGTYLAAIGDVVVVTFNYRLNLFGLFHPAVDDTGKTFKLEEVYQLYYAIWTRMEKNLVQFGYSQLKTEALVELFS